MKPLLIAVALALPISAAASVAMEPQEVLPADAVAPPQAAAGGHRPLFIVKYVLRRAPPEGAPQIVMDNAAPQIAPPAKGYPATSLGAVQDDPNVLVCHDWGCQRRP